jgi:hypothetical protein
MCAKHSTETQGGCPGDSGGPLITEIGGFFYQLGIIHGALYECTNETPGIYVRLDHPKIQSYIHGELGSALPNRPIEGLNTLIIFKGRFNTYHSFTFIFLEEPTCQERLCQNEGTCEFDDKTEEYNCKCHPLYIGDKCQHPIGRHFYI